MMRPLFATCVSLALAGCVLPPTLTPEILSGKHIAEDGPSQWSFDVEPAMAPDFSNERETYPVLLIHKHHLASERQKREMENVVCLTLDGAPLPIERPRRDDVEATFCPGPSADPATGRVFVDRDEFRTRGAEALAVFLDSCRGGVIHLGPEQAGFLVPMPGHKFEVRFLPNGTFAVDGRWIEPGTSIKIGYFLSYGSREDEEYVRVAFEAPGRWRLAGLSGAPDAGDGRIPTRPDRGSGLVVDVPLAPGSVREPIELLVAATPWDVVGVEAMRLVHGGDRLTELTLRLATREGVVTWYGAGRTGETLRVLGSASATPANESALPVDGLLDAFDLTWSALGQKGGAILDVRLAPDTAFSTAGPLRLTAPLAALPCGEGCVMLRDEGEWRAMLAPSRELRAGARTIEVIVHSDEEPRTTWWHAP